MQVTRPPAFAALVRRVPVKLGRSAGHRER